MMLYRSCIKAILILLLSSPGALSFDTLRVEASLDTLRKDISGTVSYNLPMSPELSGFEFQLYPNVYSSEDSPYLKDKNQLKNILSRSKKWGEAVIDSVYLDGKNVSRYLDIDYTVAVVSPEGQSKLNGKEVKIFFRTRLAEMADRLFYYGNNYLLDGWFPFPAILKDDGTWYNPVYGSFSELVGGFYQFEIDLHIPTDLKVAAAVSPAIVNTDDTLTGYHFSFGPAHDFALALSADYLIDTSRIGDVEVMIYYRDFERSALDRIKTAVNNSLEYMAGRAGQYMYDRLTLVMADLVEAGGIEMPGFIVLGSPRGGTMFSRYYESLVIHETVHQWFYGAVNSNQIENPWMDEAITNFFTLKIVEEYWGKEANTLDFAGMKFSERDQLRPFSIITADYGPLNRPTYSFVDNTDYFGSIYSRGALIVETIDNLLTDSLSRIFWSSYYREYKYKSPTPDDFLELIGEIGGEEIKTASEKLIYGAGEIDYTVSNLTNDQKDSVTCESSFILGKKGRIDLPVEYCMVLYNGDTVCNVWKPENNLEKITVQLPSPILEIIIDPDGVYAIDGNLLNNSITFRTDSSPALRLSSGVMFLVESLLSFLGGL